MIACVQNSRNFSCDVCKGDPVIAMERAELQRRLRQKIRNKRHGTPHPEDGLRQQAARDPATALLNMGITDPALLSLVKNITPRNVQSTLQKAQEGLKDDDGDEQLPPCFGAPKDNAQDSDEELPVCFRTSNEEAEDLEETH